MKKIKLLLFILIIFLSGVEAYCQKIFRDGYIVKKTGESFIGMVEYSTNQNIPSVCNFKRFDIARTVKYSPGEIQAFGYKNGNRYESKNLDNKISFFEVIVTGKIILYSKKGKYYIDKDHHGLVELKNGPVTYTISGEKTEYKSLSEFLVYITDGKTGTISSGFSLKSDLVPLITAYNKNTGNPYTVFNRTITEKQIAQEARESGANRNRIGIVSGLNFYKLNLKPLSNSYLPDPEKETGLISGLTLERVLSRKNDRFSIRMDLLFYKQTFYCYDELNNSSGAIFRNDTFFDFTGIKFPLLAQYSFTGNRIIPYFNAGFAYQFLIDKDFHRIEEIEYFQKEIRTFEYNDMAFNKGEMSAVGGFGIRTRIFNNLNLHLQGRIEVGSGLFIKSVGYVREFKQNSIQSTFLIGITF